MLRKSMEAIFIIKDSPIEGLGIRIVWSFWVFVIAQLYETLQDKWFGTKYTRHVSHMYQLELSKLNNKKVPNITSFTLTEYINNSM